MAMLTHPASVDDTAAVASIHDGLYIPESVLMVAERHALLWGCQRGVNRHLVIERVARVTKSEASRAMAARSSLVRLSHDNLPQCLDVFVEDHTLYVVMATGEGAPLTRLDELITPRLAVRMGIQICNALNYLHGLGGQKTMLAVEPATVFLTRAERVKLTNLAALIGLALPAEHLAGHRCQSKTDEVFGVGAALHYALTRWPGHYCDGAPAVETMRPDVTSDLATIIGRALDPKPAARFADSAAMRFKLLRLQ